MRSAIYQGIVSHRRRDQIRHGFQYPLFMLYLDLDEVDDFFRLSPLWSRERFNWASFYRQDYLAGAPGDNLKQAVYREIKRQTGQDFNGRVCMLAHVRYLGYCFNPASFYYCYEENQLRYLITEVSNTPWGETHCYVACFDSTIQTVNGQYSSQADKVFHVSPFLDMDQHYTWRINAPGNDLRISISNSRQGQKVFNATLSLQRQEANARNLNRILLRFPAVTIKAVAGIYWQALRLWWRGAPIYDHPHTTADSSTHSAKGSQQ